MIGTGAAGDMNDVVTYNHDGGDDETVNAEIRPWAEGRDIDGNSEHAIVETQIGLIVGTETGDVSDVAIGDLVTFASKTWAVVEVLERMGATGPVLLQIRASAPPAISGQDGIRSVRGRTTRGAGMARGAG